jgi:rare lipoprotein A
VIVAIAACGSAQANPDARPRASTTTSSSESAPAPAPASDVVDVIEGRASYYSDRLTGRSTASGEPYDPRELTAASRDLPFGTRVRVIREDNGRSVIVRVNDRGPFGDRRRVVDVSRAAAEARDLIRAGVVSVRVVVLSP